VKKIVIEGKRGKFALASVKRPITGRKLARSTVHRTASIVYEDGARSIRFKSQRYGQSGNLYTVG